MFLIDCRVAKIYKISLLRLVKTWKPPFLLLVHVPNTCMLSSLYSQFMSGLFQRFVL